MLFSDRRLVLTLCASLLIPAGLTWANVNLQFTTPTVTVARGGQISTTLQITIGTEQVTSVDYYLLGSASSVFSIKSRNITTSGSVFPDFSAGSDSQVAASSVNGLNPQNGIDLGSGVTDVSTFVTGGTYKVADYVLSVSSSAAPGVYTIQTTYFSGHGWVGPESQGFPESDINHPALMSVTVTPEPSGLVLLGALAVVSLRRRSRR